MNLVFTFARPMREPPFRNAGPGINDLFAITKVGLRKSPKAQLFEGLSPDECPVRLSSAREIVPVVRHSSNL